MGNFFTDVFHPNGRVLAGAIAVGGVIATAILAYQARPKVEKVLEVAKSKRSDIEASDEVPEVKERQRKELTIDTVKGLTVSFLPTAICGMVTSGLIIGSISEGEKQIQHWMGTAAMGDIAYKELYEKTREMLGDDKAKEIQAAADKSIGDKQLGIDSSDEELSAEELDYRMMQLIIECGGKELWFDAVGNRFLYTSESTILRAVANCNTRMNSNGSRAEPYITYNEFCDEAGWPRISYGDNIMWGGRTACEAKLSPNLTNAKRKGEGSYSVLDWWQRPAIDLDRNEWGDFVRYR